MPKYSQVFLKDVKACERIANALNPDDFCAAVEIGPGRGALTEFLYPLWKEKLTAVEIDPRMAEKISGKFPALKLLNQDFLSLKDEQLCADSSGPVAFIGNLPYECSTAILLKVLSFPRFGAAAFMFQKEVADKILAHTGSHDYSYFSIAAQAQSLPELFEDVPATSFSPVPKVDSTVLSFRPRTVFKSEAEKEKVLRVVKQAFAHRRKTLANSLALSRCVERAEIERVLKAAGFEPTLRPQNLSVEDYIKLAEFF